jgi:3-methyl-2-oxobutanoate hydroxymethyltransferase
MERKKKMIPDLFRMKQNGEKIAMVTAYDYTMAKIIDQSNVDIMLVGDSAGTVIQGYDTTLEVTLDDMVYHCKAVSRGASQAFVVGDMPFLTYHGNVDESVKNAGRLMQEGKAQAVKLEGGRSIVPHVKKIIAAQIPVMGHLGLTPQSFHMLGGFKVQGREEAQAEALIEDALALQDAGVFAIVLEAIPAALAKRVTEALRVPTIGIGAGKHCDGQVLVCYDMLGMFDDFKPKFVKRYANLKETITEAMNTYAAEVKNVTFPDDSHIF